MSSPQLQNVTTDAEMRVQIAQDIRDLLASNPPGLRIGGLYAPLTSFGADTIPYYSDARDALTDTLAGKNSSYRCQVCAKGALLMAHILRHDKVDVGAVQYANRETAHKLLPYFPARMLDEIEVVFEQTTMYVVSEIPFSELNRIREEAARWRELRIGSCRLYMDRRELLDAIMQNIINNNGDFKIEDVVLPPANEGEANAPVHDSEEEVH